MATFHLYEDHWTRKFKEPQKIYILCDGKLKTCPNQFTSWYKFAKWLKLNRNDYINPNLLSHGAKWITFPTTKDWFQALTDYDDEFKPMIFLTEDDKLVRWWVAIRYRKMASHEHWTLDKSFEE